MLQSHLRVIAEACPQWEGVDVILYAVALHLS
jgi:hypothetical protein